MPELTVLPENRKLTANGSETLMQVLRAAGIFLDAPCGGNGTCGKCKVMVEGEEVLACRTVICRDAVVTIAQRECLQVLETGPAVTGKTDPLQEGYRIAFDIGTTTVVCYLLDGITGQELAKASMANPQAAYGADVISRIQAALRGQLESLTLAIRQGMTALIQSVCREADVLPGAVAVISVVGNPAMQQLFLGISPENLAGVPFAPVLTEAKTVPCGEYLPICSEAALLIVPDISGYIGADTLGCVLSTELYRKEAITLLVDIGTNGEMVLGNQGRMIACSTAAGPALEGANIRFGMRGTDGAIDHVWLEDGKLRCSVIGGGEAGGICGSGLIDAVAVALELGWINRRGRIGSSEGVISLTETIYLTQEDIRQVQLAKGAVCAGIRLMAKQLGLEMRDIQKVQLAGAFGSFLNPRSACRMGLLPEELLDRIEAVGNAAGAGAKMLACDRNLLLQTGELAKKIEFLELASLPEFPKTFAKAMHFREEAT